RHDEAPSGYPADAGQDQPRGVAGQFRREARADQHDQRHDHQGVGQQVGHVEQVPPGQHRTPLHRPDLLDQEHNDHERQHRGAGQLELACADGVGRAGLAQSPPALPGQPGRGGGDQDGRQVNPPGSAGRQSNGPRLSIHAWSASGLSARRNGARRVPTSHHGPRASVVQAGVVESGHGRRTPGGGRLRSGLITNPDKVLFAERGETKGDLAEHYVRVAGPLLRVMGGRPVLLQRFPEGAGGPSLADDPDHADELRIDLDPTPGVDFAQIREASGELRTLLAEAGITGYLKTTGSRGLHVYAKLHPRWDSYQVRSAAVAVARELERRRPDLITAAWWKEERGQRVFVDYNQNAPHKTVFGAWSVRARPGAQVSTPVAWSELDDIHPDQFTIASLAARLDTADGDPWRDRDDDPQSLEPLLEMNARDRASGLMDAPWPPVYPKQPDDPPRGAPR